MNQYEINNDYPLDIEWFNDIIQEDTIEVFTEEDMIEEQEEEPNTYKEKPPLLKLQLWNSNTGLISQSFKIINMRLSEL